MSGLKTYAVVSVLLCLLPVSVFSEDAAPAVSGEVSSLFNETGTFLAGLKSFRFDAEVVLAQGDYRETSSYSFACRWPYCLHMDMTLEDESLLLISNDEKLMLCLKKAGECRISDRPEELGSLVGWLTQEPALRRIFSRDLTAGWMQNLRQTSATKELLDETPCYRIDLSFDRTKVQVWVPEEGDPFPVKLRADLSPALPRPGDHRINTILFRNWEANPELPAELFNAQTPEKMKRVDSFPSPVLADASGNMSTPVLLGAQAPPFTLTMLSGESFDFADHRGKDAVVMEFWATWCRPCQNALKVIRGLRETFQDKPVVWAAVNLMESREKVRGWHEKTGCTLPIALDPQGETANAFRLEAVPTTVIIGQDGTIQAVHVGYDRSYEKDIKEKLDMVLAGKNPVNTLQRFTPGQRLRYRLGMDRDAFCAVFVGY